MTFGLTELKAPVMCGHYPVIRAGMLDSISPAVITALVLFLFLVSWAARRPRFFRTTGVGFVAGLFVFRCLLVVGRFDDLLRQEATGRTLEIVHLVLSAAAAVFGSLFLRDWWAGKILTGQRQPLIDLFRFRRAGTPAPGTEARIFRSLFFVLLEPFRFVAVALLAFILGGVAVLLGTVWPENAGVWFILYEFMTPGRTPMAVFLLVLYGALFVWPVLAFWFFMSRLFSAGDRFGNRLERLLPRIRVCCAAFFLGYAAGILNSYLF